MSRAGYLANMHISPLTCERLRKAGYQVVRVPEVLSPTASGPEIVQYARDYGMTILTCDLDYSALVALARASKPSIVSVRLTRPDPESVSQVLLRVLPQLEDDLSKGAVASVTEQRIRVRLLPIRLPEQPT